MLAFDDLEAPQALRYFFRLLDVRGLGYLDVFAISTFYRDVAEALASDGFDARAAARPRRASRRELTPRGAASARDL